MEKPRTDLIELNAIFTRIKNIMKEKEMEKAKEDKRRKIIENTPFV